MGTPCFQSRARLAQKSSDAATNFGPSLFKQYKHTPPFPVRILKMPNWKHYALATEESQVQTPEALVSIQVTLERVLGRIVLCCKGQENNEVLLGK
jgi:hypothetical protein